MIVLHIPHSSTVVPEDVRKSFVLSKEELERQIFLLTDMYTDELFDITHRGVERIIYPVNRLVLDPERFIDDAKEEMAERGMGVVYTKTAHLTRLRIGISREERVRLIDTYYTPHHRSLTKAVQRNLALHKRCLIIDCHSYASVALPYEKNQSSPRPEICIGTDSYHTPPQLAEFISSQLTSFGYKTGLNKPFSGSIVPLIYYCVNPAVFSVMLEINKKLYMNETTGDKLPGFDALRDAIRKLVSILCEWIEKN
jgi:N-formylglutamate deformylase